MPYIGIPPVTGDSTSSFKVLDSISSFTQAFNGSSSSVVSLANNTISITEHRFITGQRVTYSTTGTAIGGLTSGSVYYIIKEDQNSIKLANSLSDANNNIARDLTSLGVGSTHTINVAFDGVNTKFKATYDNGTKALFTRAAQLMISINGVIQQPFDTATPSNGFGFDLDGIIVFSTAPSVSDVFWGTIISNTLATFDISDNVVDTFTGNGSSLSFTLSKESVNNENVLVTINGVVQYPSDNTTVRSYSVFGNLITFTEAPGNGAVIQVRHIGFAGASTSGVTGFYGRTGNVGLTTNDNINVGIVSAITYYGDGSNLEGVTAAGLGTALSTDETNPLNKIYYTNQVLSIGQTVTVDVPNSAVVAYTQYTDITVEQNADLIIEDGDDLIPDVLGLSTTGVIPLVGNGGRVRADTFTNKAGNGAPSFPNGLSVTGFTTTANLKVDGSAELFGGKSIGTGFLADIISVENMTTISATTTLTSPSVNDSTMYTKHQIVSIDEGISLIIDEGDAFVIDALQFL